MNPVSSIALSGMNAATTGLGVAAHNIANLGTRDFRRQQVQLESQPGGGVAAQWGQAAEPGEDLATDVVGLLSARNAFLANLAVFRASDSMTRSLLDIAR